MPIHFASPMRSFEGLQDTGGLYLTDREYLSIQFDSTLNSSLVWSRTIVIYAFRNSYIHISQG
jgi:hypothetical protein